MDTFRELKRAAKKKIETEQRPVKLAVMGNCTTQFMVTAIKGSAVKENIGLEIFEANYNQIEMQLLDEKSDVFRFRPDFILLYLSAEILYEEFMGMELTDKSEFAEIYLHKITHYWDLITNRCDCKVLQFNFVEIDDKCFGNYSCKTEYAFTFQLRKLNYMLQEKELEHSGIYPIDLLAVQNRFGRKEMFDSSMYYTAKMTLSLNILPFVAAEVLNVVKAIRGIVKKCIILDLDNTLWGGVIGDDGLGKIEIGGLGRGAAFTDFQKWLKQLKDRGILLAVCSKNDEIIAREPFLMHDEMILKLEDFSFFIANWNDKVSNIKVIREALNIGMDAIVFLDDNPFERNLVRKMLPDIVVPELPEDPSQYLEFLQRNNWFETASFSEEDTKRTKQYQAENARKRLQGNMENIDEYLKELDMIGKAEDFSRLHYSRIAQLTQRSNQFNLRTVRYTEGDIEKIAQDHRFITMVFSLTDRFGEQGIVSVIILKKVDEDTLFIDTWVMSCRVLNRGMEEFVINCMVDKVKLEGYEKIIGEYLPTAKNSMVKEIYASMGFQRLDERTYFLKCKDYKYQDTFIRGIKADS